MKEIKNIMPTTAQELIEKYKRKKKLLEDFISAGNKLEQVAEIMVVCEKCSKNFKYLAVKHAEVVDDEVVYGMVRDLPQFCENCQKEIDEIVIKKNLLGDFSFIPPVYSKVLYDEKLAIKDKELIDKYGGIYFYGGLGTGKTVRMYNLHAYLGRVVFYEMSYVLRQIRANDFEKEDDLIEELKNASILFLDDFGTEAGSDYQLSILYEVINYRWQYVKPVVLSSNFSLFEWYEKNKQNPMGARIIDRLKTMVCPVQIDGKTKRKSNKIVDK